MSGRRPAARAAGSAGRKPASCRVAGPPPRPSPGASARRQWRRSAGFSRILLICRPPNVKRPLCRARFCGRLRGGCAAERGARRVRHSCCGRKTEKNGQNRLTWRGRGTYNPRSPLAAAPAGRSRFPQVGPSGGGWKQSAGKAVRSLTLWISERDAQAAARSAPARVRDGPALRRRGRARDRNGESRSMTHPARSTFSGGSLPGNARSM